MTSILCSPKIVENYKACGTAEQSADFVLVVVGLLVICGLIHRQAAR